MKFTIFAASLVTTTLFACTTAFTKAAQVENYGFIDKTGKLKIKLHFDEVQSFSQGLAAVKTGDKWGYVDKTGKLKINPRFDEVKSFSQGLAAVSINQKWGYINKTGEVVIKPQFLTAVPFYEGVAVVDIDGEWVHIDQRGIVVKPFSGNIYGSSEGLEISFYKDGGGTCGPVLCVYGYNRHLQNLSNIYL